MSSAPMDSNISAESAFMSSRMAISLVWKSASATTSGSPHLSVFSLLSEMRLFS